MAIESSNITLLSADLRGVATDSESAGAFKREHRVPANHKATSNNNMQTTNSQKEGDEGERRHINLSQIGKHWPRKC